MNPKIKDFLGAIAGIGVLVFAVIAWVYVDAYSKSIEPSSFRSFAVSAEGKVVAVPDIARFTVSIVTEGGENLAALQTENVTKANQTIAFLKKEGVEEKDIQTRGFTISPRYQQVSCSRNFGSDSVVCPPATIVGYTVIQTIQVKVRNLAKAGSMVSGVVENGANTVSELSFTVDGRDIKESEARAQAIEKAKEKAQAVAKAGGFRVGRLLSIQESGIPYYPIYERSFAQGFEGDIAAESIPAPNLEPGSQDITVSVTLVYEIQ